MWVDRLRNRKQSHYVLKLERIGTRGLPFFHFHYPDECVTKYFLIWMFCQPIPSGCLRVGGY